MHGRAEDEAVGGVRCRGEVGDSVLDDAGARFEAAQAAAAARNGLAADPEDLRVYAFLAQGFSTSRRAV